jgi:HPt (histidine-containing phosphotransfer) domain-containing protein
LGPEKTAIPASNSDPALDRHVLAELANIQRNGRPGFMDRVITLYLQTAAELIADLEAASAADELAVLQRASHTLKPCSASVGALSLAALCEALEEAARAGSVPDPASRVAAIAEEYRRVEAALMGRLCHAD